MSGCHKLVAHLTHTHGGTLDLPMTVVQVLIWVAFLAPSNTRTTRFSQKFGTECVTETAQTVPYLCVSWKVTLTQVNFVQFFCVAIQDLLWCNIWYADSPANVFIEHLSLLVGRYVSTNVIRVHNKDKPWFSGQNGHDFDL